MITIGTRQLTNHYLFIHEIFHLLDIVVLGGTANKTLLAAQRADPNFPNRPTVEGDGFISTSWGFAGGNLSEWQKSRLGASGEEFADMGIGWTYNQWEVNETGVGWSSQGQARASFMDVNMAIWLTQQIP